MTSSSTTGPLKDDLNLNQLLRDVLKVANIDESLHDDTVQAFQTIAGNRIAEQTLPKFQGNEKMAHLMNMFIEEHINEKLLAKEMVNSLKFGDMEISQEEMNKIIASSQLSAFLDVVAGILDRTPLETQRKITQVLHSNTGFESVFQSWKQQAA